VEGKKIDPMEKNVVFGVCCVAENVCVEKRGKVEKERCEEVEC